MANPTTTKLNSGDYAKLLYGPEIDDRLLPAFARCKGEEMVSGATNNSLHRQDRLQLPVDIGELILAFD